MASVFPQSRTYNPVAPLVGPGRLSRTMSWHASGALLAFAGLQIWGVVALIDESIGRSLPFVALAMLLLVAIPFSRRIERRWHDLAANALPSPGLLVRYRQDRSRLWRFALLVPTLWIGVVALVVRSGIF